MADLSNAAGKEEFYRTCLHIKLTNNGMLIDGEWSNERFLGLLKCKLMQHDKMKSLSVCTKTQCDAHALQLLHSIIHSGIYNEQILLALEKKGIKALLRERICISVYFVLSPYKRINFRNAVTQYHESNEIWSS
jgi:hypothetical protein